MKIIDGKLKELGDFKVSRVLPQIGNKSVGPFVFFDHLPPADFAPGEGIDVRPHPHIGLATITFLIEGELFHRDSLGTANIIKPGSINLMVAGNGIVHSERTPPELRKSGFSVEALQLWIALPKDKEDMDPEFHHIPASEILTWEDKGCKKTLLIGEYQGKKSPVPTFSKTFYMICETTEKHEFEISSDDAEEFAVFVASGSCAETSKLKESIAANQMLVCRKESAALTLEANSKIAIIGGAALPEPRTIWWNLVSTSKEKIEAAKSRWQNGEFPKVPGDEKEFIPLPES